MRSRYVLVVPVIDPRWDIEHALYVELNKARTEEEAVKLAKKECHERFGNLLPGQKFSVEPTLYKAISFSYPIPRVSLPEIFSGK